MNFARLRPWYTIRNYRRSLYIQFSICFIYNFWRNFILNCTLKYVFWISNFSLALEIKFCRIQEALEAIFQSKSQMNILVYFSLKSRGWLRTKLFVFDSCTRRGNENLCGYFKLIEFFVDNGSMWNVGMNTFRLRKLYSQVFLFSWLETDINFVVAFRTILGTKQRSASKNSQEFW